MKNIKNYIGMFVLMLAVVFLGTACSCTKDTETYKLNIAIYDDETNQPTANAGSLMGFLSSKEYESGEVLTVTATVNDGWSFLGFFEGLINKTQGNTTYVVTMDRDITLTARYVRKRYNLNFFDENNNPLTSLNKQLRVGDATNLVQMPNKTGLVFDGWVYKDTGIAYNETTFSKLNNVDLKATYAEGYGITYKQKNATDDWVTIDTGISTPQAMWPKGYKTAQNTPLPTLDVNATTGYEFKGWYDNDSFSGSPIVEISAGTSGDKILFAKVDPIIYTYSFVTNTTQTITGSNYTVEDVKALPAPAARTGYNFVGWFENANFNGSPVTSISKGSVGNKTFYAKWEGKEINLILDYNGGQQISLIVTKYDFDKGVTLPRLAKYGTNDSLPGYVFLGWCTTNPTDISTPVIANSVIAADDVDILDANGTQTKKLYAKWGFKVIVELQGGTVNGSSSNYEHIFFAPNTTTTYDFREIKNWGDQSGVVTAPTGMKFLRWELWNPNTNQWMGDDPTTPGVIDSWDSVDMSNEWSGVTYKLRAIWGPV